MMSNPSDSAAGSFRFTKTRRSICAPTLVFPYTKGMLFQNAVFQRDGQSELRGGVPKPPLSTQQILHPEKYFCRREADRPGSARPAPAARLQGPGGRVAGRTGTPDPAGTVSRARRRPTRSRRTGAARTSNCSENKKAGARGAAVCRRMGQMPRVARHTSPPIARSCQEMEEDDGDHGNRRRRDGLGDDGRFELRRKGAIVTSVEGLPGEAEAPAAQAAIH